MDDIFDKIKQNFEEVKKREEEVYKQEAALKAESEGVRQIKAELDEARRESQPSLYSRQFEKPAFLPDLNANLQLLRKRRQLWRKFLCQTKTLLR